MQRPAQAAPVVPAWALFTTSGRGIANGLSQNPFVLPLEQRQREDKARRDQGDAEQQAGQEQAERVHGERISRVGAQRAPKMGSNWVQAIPAAGGSCIGL